MKTALRNTALVTGGSGFLGSVIADELVRRGYSVRVFDRQASPHLQSGQEMIVGDIRDAEALETAAQGCSHLFHLAALADLDHARDRPRDAAETNILGTISALDAARKNGVQRFLFASTVYVYSRAGGFYRCSKQACEAFIEEYQRKFDLPYTVLRYGSLYGPRSTKANGVFRLLSEAASGAVVRHVGSPEDTREYVHVEDAARLTVDALAEEFENAHLTITGQHPMRLKDLFTMFSEILGRRVQVDYQNPPEGQFDEHYRMTPYAFSPRVGRKLTSNHYVDMGQGILHLLEQIHEQALSTEGAGADHSTEGEQ